MTKPFADIASEMRHWFDTFGAYIEGASIMPRTRGALRELHSTGVSIANELQTRAADVSTCDRLTALEGTIKELVASDAAVHAALPISDDLSEAESVFGIKSIGIAGEGSFGKAYFVDESTVLKITDGKQEVAAVEAIRRFESTSDFALQGIVSFYTNPYALKSGKYAYLVERVTPVDAKNPEYKKYDRYGGAYVEEEGADLPSTAFHLVGDNDRKFIKSKRKAKDIEERRRVLNILASEPGYDLIANDVIALMDKGIFIWDITPHNIGLASDGTLKLFDPQIM